MFSLAISVTHRGWAEQQAKHDNVYLLWAVPLTNSALTVIILGDTRKLNIKQLYLTLSIFSGVTNSSMSHLFLQLVIYYKLTLDLPTTKQWKAY